MSRATARWEVEQAIYSARNDRSSVLLRQLLRARTRVEEAQDGSQSMAHAADWLALAALSAWSRLPPVQRKRLVLSYLQDAFACRQP